MVQHPGAARLGHELGAEPDEPAGRDAEVDAHPARAVVDHLLHAALAQREELGDDAEVVLGNVDREELDRLVALAVDLADDDLRLPDGELEALAPHRLDEHRELELAAALHFPRVGRSVGLTRSDTLPTSSCWSRFSTWRAVSFLPSWPASTDVLMPTVIDEARLVDDERRQRTRVVDVGERLADRDLGDARRPR